MTDLEGAETPAVTDDSPALQLTDGPQLYSSHRKWLLERGVDPATAPVEFRSLVAEDGERLCILPRKGPFQARAMAGQDRKYLSDKSTKGLFWTTDPAPPGNLVWLVEGPMDAVAMRLAGAQYVAASMGAGVSPDQAYELKESYTLLCYDRDGAGWQGAVKASERLKEFQAAHTVVELPAGGKDPGDLWRVDPDAFCGWVSARTLEYQPDEQRYVEGWRGLVAHRPVPTGFTEIDEALGGGLLPGHHVLVGHPGLGKTALCVSLLRAAARRRRKVLYLSTELSKREIWARLSAGIPGAPAWGALERDPSLLPAECHAEQARLARYIHTTGNVPVARLLQIADQLHPELVIVDYLQGVRGIGGGDSSQILGQVRDACSRLTAYSRDREMPVLSISSTPRGDGPLSMSSAKYSGDVEYDASSVSGLQRTGYGDASVVHWTLFKNRRGPAGASSVVDIDLGRNEREGLV